jgi:hypothetical protein
MRRIEPCCERVKEEEELDFLEERLLLAHVLTGLQDLHQLVLQS